MEYLKSSQLDIANHHRYILNDDNNYRTFLECLFSLKIKNYVEEM